MATSLTTAQIAKIATKVGISSTRVGNVANDPTTSQLQGDADLILLEMYEIILSLDPPSDGPDA